MKVLLIDGLSEKSGQVNLGLGFLAQYVRARHDVRIMALAYHDEAELVRAAGEADVVGISSLTAQFRACLRLAQAIRAAHPATPIVVGGIHATAVSGMVIAEPVVDYVIQGEGEIGFSALLEMLETGQGDPAAIPGLVYTDEQGEIHKNPPEFIKELDTIGMPAWDLLDRERTSTRKRNIITSRGCPFTCSYCYNSTMRRKFKFKYRRRGVDSVIEESLFLKNEGADYINFSDDLFLVNKAWLKDFAAKWTEKVNLPFSCTARPEMAIQNKDCLSFLKEAGLRNVWIGIESGNATIRREIFNRKMSDADIVEAFRIMQEMGLETRSFNIVGVPTEGWREAFQTFRLNWKVKPVSASHYTLMPYPETEMWRIAREEGLFVVDDHIFFEDEGNVQATSRIDHGYLHTGKLNRYQITALRYWWRACFPEYKWYRFHKRLRDVLLGCFWAVRGLFCSERPDPDRPLKPLTPVTGTDDASCLRTAAHP